MRAAVGDGVVTFTSVADTISRDAADLLASRKRVQSIDRTGVSSIGLSAISTVRTSGVILVDPEMNIAQDTTLEAAMLARMSSRRRPSCKRRARF